MHSLARIRNYCADMSQIHAGRKRKELDLIYIQLEFKVTLTDCLPSSTRTG